jgi:uncharacterized RDD family membrane protein YckC
MINAQLLDYVRQQIAQGVNKETIRLNLTSSGGWHASDVDEVFTSLGQGVVPAVPMTSGLPPVAPVKYAGFWIRWVAMFLDSLILSPLTFGWSLLSSVIFKSAELSFNASQPTVLQIMVPAIGQTLILWAYFVLMTHYKGATLGKMLVGITVKSASSENLSFGRVLLRETVGKFISGILLVIGYIMAAFGQKKQALHDKLAHTVVVYKDPSKPHRAGLIIGIILAALLPAIAIVGIMSSVVLVSLNSARQKGYDAKTISNLSQVRLYVENTYDANVDGYSHARDCFSGVFDNSDIQRLISDTWMKDVRCYADGLTYAVSAAMSAPDSNYCLDSAGHSGKGVAVDDNSQASCQLDASASKSTTSSPVGATATMNDLYAYNLPTGWESMSNSGQGVQALNKAAGYVLSMATIPIPSNLGNITSINELMNEGDMVEVVKSEFPDGVIKYVVPGSIGGEVAIVTKFDATVSSVENGEQKQSKPLSMLQYNTVYKGALYTFIFMSASIDQNKAIIDFQQIIDSFVFKQ